MVKNDTLWQGYIPYTCGCDPLSNRDWRGGGGEALLRRCGHLPPVLQQIAPTEQHPQPDGDA
jgi:hypothetical protein